jgi:tetratricopeptide (TPR) repeat protein
MNKHLPSIPRSITESLLSGRTFFFLKYIFVGAVSGALVIAIALQSVELKGNMLQAEQVVQDRDKLLQEVVYWKQIANTYSGYRDIYYRIATLQYKLGNKEESKKYLQKALELDPNFSEARVLGAKIEATPTK